VIVSGRARAGLAPTPPKRAGVRHHRRRGLGARAGPKIYSGGRGAAGLARVHVARFAANSRAQQSKAGSLCLSVVVVVVCESVSKQLLLQQALRSLVVLPLTLFVKIVRTLSHSLVIGINQ
jgi:hypothetical protein